MKPSQKLILVGLGVTSLLIFCCCGVMLVANIPVGQDIPIDSPITVTFVSWQDHHRLVEGRNLVSVDVILTNTTDQPVMTFGNVYFIKTDIGAMIPVNFFASEMAGYTGRIGGNVLPGQQELTLGFFIPVNNQPVSFVFDDPRWSLVEFRLE